MRTALLLLVAIFAIGVFSQDTCPRCTPLCQNGDGTPKTCGDDGCGGSCGICPAGQACCRGTCACQPNCAGRECGDDGCGYQSCGSCSSTQTCSNGICVGTAVAECAGRQCGSNRAGGSCGSCPTGQRCRGGQCECYYDCEERNCGPAVQAAGTNTGLCPSRTCGTCPSGFTCGANGRCSQETPCNVTITVVDCSSRQFINSNANVAISGSSSYSATVTVNAGQSYVWTTPGLGAFTFATTAQGYLDNSEQVTLNANTQSVQLCMNLAELQLDIRDRLTDTSIDVSASVTWTGTASGSLTFLGNGPQLFTHGGFGNYNFVAVPSAYWGQGTLSFQVVATTTIVIIYVDALPVQLDVRSRETGLSVTIAVSLTYTGTASGSVAWNGLQQWTHGGWGAYSFTAVPSTTEYITTVTQVSVERTTTIVIVFLDLGARCGDGTCSNGEDYDFCPEDCLSLVLEMEDSEGFGPVIGASINYYGNRNPRTPDQTTGPNRNSEQPDKTRTSQAGSNIIAELTYTKGLDIYFEAFATDYINFYWVANSSDSRAVSEDGIYKLRVHLSSLLQSNNKNYRFVNTWKPIDAPPLPYGPTDLNLHLFHPDGALDINPENNPLIVQGFEIGRVLVDNKQSGGPATADISPGAGQMVAVWNSKPPRSSAITSSQNNRYIIHSGSYVVVYGKTSNAAQGKQLGQYVLNEYLAESAAAAADTVSDLWYVGQMTVSQPGVDQPEIVPMKRLKQADIQPNRDMIFDCEAYDYCNSFRVPYSDNTGKRDE